MMGTAGHTFQAGVQAAQLSPTHPTNQPRNLTTVQSFKTSSHNTV